MAVDLYTNSVRTPAGGRLKRWPWACEALVREWVETKKPIRAVVQELEIPVWLVWKKTLLPQMFKTLTSS